MGWLLAPRPAMAQDEQALSVVLGNGPYFTTERWMPVRVMAINRSTSEAKGQIEFPFDQGAEKVVFTLPITVPARTTLTVTAQIYVPPQPDLPTNRKSTDAPPLCTAVWRNTEGRMLSRCPILGRAIDEDNDGTADRIRVDRPFIVSLVGGPDVPNPLPDVTIDAGTFMTLFQSTQGTRLLNMVIDAEAAPRDRLGYDAAAVVIIDGGILDRLDAGQQQALIDYMTVGGSLLLADAQGSVDPAETWLAPYLPARRIGSRYASSLAVQSGDQSKTHKLVVPLDLSEWVADPSIPGAKIVAGEANYVHAAYQRVGLGRMIVTSFPVSGLDVKDPAVRQIFQNAFPGAPRVRWENSKLAVTQNEFLESMVGLKVPPWIVAATIVSAYVIIVLVIQLLARQSWRPAGFGAVVGVSILVAIGLVVFSFFRDKSVDLSMARINVLDLDRGGVRNEAVTLLGPENESFPISAVPGATLRQASGGESKPLKLTISPIRAEGAAVFPRRIERVWQSTAAVPVEQSLHVVGQFDEQGLGLSVDNRIGVIQSPVLVGPSGRYSLPTIADGTSQVRADDTQTNAATVQLEAQQLRGRILDAAMTSASSMRSNEAPRLDESILLAGWLANAPPPLLKLPDGQSPSAMHSNALARTRLELKPSPVGSKVHIAKAFTQMLTGDIGALPFDPTKGEWLETFTSQEFLVGFAFPPGVGKVKTTHVTIDFGASAPQQTITLRRGQVKNDRVQINPGGTEIGTWSQLIGSNTVDFEVEPGDVDVNGWAWIMVSIEGPAIGGQTARWRITDFAVAYDGVIEGPPQPIVMPKREAPTPTAEAPKPKPQPAKKPTSKPAPTTKKTPTTKTAAPKKESKPK